MNKLFVRKSFIKLTLLFFLFFYNYTIWGQNKEQRPNFVIVMTDDQGYGDIGYLGNDKVKTPNLDNMAQHSLRLDRFYTAPVCSPTRASVLTGRYPTRAGVFSWGHALRPQEKSFVEILKKYGYQTGFFGKWHLGSIEENKPTNPTARGFENWYAAANFYDNNPWMSHNGKPLQLTGESSDVTVNLALDYIKNAAKSTHPFIVFIWFGSPHLPHEATDELKKLYPLEPENMQNYYGELTGIDRSVGKLRKELSKLAISDHTLIWFSSDNGGKLPEASNGNLRGQKGTLWEGGIRVPALIEWPGMIQNKISNIPASTVDIFPTVLELAGLDFSEVKYPMDGTSLVPLIRGKVNHRVKPLGFWNYDEIKGNGMKSDQIIQNYQSVLNGKMLSDSVNEGLLNPPNKTYKGLDHYPYSGQSAWIDNEWKLYQDGNTFELYNLKNDLKEEHDVAKQYPERVEKMKEALLNWQNSVIRSIQGEDYK